jgi:hypothetical protein
MFPIHHQYTDLGVRWQNVMNLPEELLGGEAFKSRGEVGEEGMGKETEKKWQQE